MSSHEQQKAIGNGKGGFRRVGFRWIVVGLIIGIATISAGSASTEQPTLDSTPATRCPDGETCDTGGSGLPSYGMGGGGDLSSCASGGNYWGEDQR